MNLSAYPTSALVAEISRRRQSAKRASALRAVASAFGLPEDVLLGRSRYRAHDEARHALVAIMRWSGMSMVEVAHALDRAGPDTIAKSLKRHRDCMEALPDYAEKYRTAALMMRKEAP